MKDVRQATGSSATVPKLLDALIATGDVIEVKPTHYIKAKEVAA